MTAIKVLSQHSELDNSGLLSHNLIDSYLLSSSIVVFSGSSYVPPNARILVAGPGITLDDSGPGNILTVKTSAPSGYQFSWNEIPTGLNDGINNMFILANNPNPVNALMFFINGVKQKQGSDSDFILSGSVITLNVNYFSGSNIDATYQY